MPRYRSISCSKCGYMQLKRDETCDQCGALTARAKRRMIGWFVQLGIYVAGGLWFYHYIQKVIPVGQ